MEENIDLKGYKEVIPTVNKSTLELDPEQGELVFVCRTQRGYVVEYDPKFEMGCSPTETLLMSAAGCLAIDVVSFLRKMRAEISSFKMEVSGERNPAPPQYYKTIDIVIHIKGKGIDSRKMDRVIALSQEKYCSVYHTLRKDLKVSVSYDITEAQ